VQDLQESEGCQDELAVRVQQLKAELVLFKGLMSSVSPHPCAFILKECMFYGHHTNGPSKSPLEGNVV